MADQLVHVWMVRLDAAGADFDRCLSWLSTDEIARVETSRSAAHRRAFVVGRGILRLLIGDILGRAPANVRFSYGAHGKPALVDAGDLRFNVSHSGEFAAYAFIEDCDVGLDVEALRPVPESDDIAARMFAPAEAEELLALPPEDRLAAFFRCWTRKEACLKAVGGGLSIALADFRVTLRPDAPARLLSIRGDQEAARTWTLHDIEPACGVVVALAYMAKSRTLQLHTQDSATALLRNR